jgi:rubrerythrin
VNKIFQVKHELWLKVLFTSFAIKDDGIKDKLYDFSMILFRHLNWIASRCKEEGIEYDYDKNDIDIQKGSNFEYFRYLVDELEDIQSLYGDDTLYFRIKTDEEYLLFYLKNLLQDSQNDEIITAFNKERLYKNKTLSKTSTDALTIFLFEETYKEYELILIYSYMRNYTTNLKEYQVYQDLIDESHFHLKSFGNMLAIMGILSIPRVVTQNLYKVTDLTKFLNDGIAEEEAAKEECVRLAKAVNDEELEKFFSFINFQENYHIELMKRLL